MTHEIIIHEVTEYSRGDWRTCHAIAYNRARQIHQQVGNEANEVCKRLELEPTSPLSTREHHNFAEDTFTFRTSLTFADEADAMAFKLAFFDGGGTTA